MEEVEQIADTSWKRTYLSYRQERILSIIVYLIAALPSLYAAFMPVRLWIDALCIGDAASFPVIASNVMRGAGLTYDGITRTNGFQPLWFLVQLPLMLGADTPMERLWIIKAIMAVLSFGAALVWGRALARLSGSRIAGLLMTAWVGASGWSIFVLYSGMETPLVLLFSGILLLQAHKVLQGSAQGRPCTIPQVFLLGVTIGLCFLARLDSAFLLLCLSLVLLPRLLRQGWRFVIPWAAGASLLSVPYLLYNKFAFGSFQPVSGVVKTYDGIELATSMKILSKSLEKIRSLLPGSLQGSFTVFLVASAAASLLVLFVLFFRLPTHRSKGRFNLLFLLPIAALLHYLYYFLRIVELNVPWHLYLQVLVVLIVLSLLPVQIAGVLRRPAARARAVVVLVSLSLILLVGSSFLYGWMKQKRRVDRHRSYLSVEWIAELPKGARMAMYDGWLVQLLAGPDVHVVDLSGLVGDLELAQMAKRDDFRGILDAYKLDYVLGWREFVDEMTPVVLHSEKVPWRQGEREFALGKIVQSEKRCQEPFSSKEKGS